jgi:LPXTG-motif cell wall-anchored protein
LIFTGVLTAAAPVGAHSSEGLMMVEAHDTADEDKVEVRARVTYLNDSDPASGASVTVNGLGPAGEALPQQALAPDGSGIYTAVVELPTVGQWTLRVASADPTASGEVVYTRREATPPSSSSPQPTDPPSSDGTETDTGDTATWLVPAGLLVLVAVVGGGFFAMRRRQRGGR